MLKTKKSNMGRPKLPYKTKQNQRRDYLHHLQGLREATIKRNDAGGHTKEISLYREALDNFLIQELGQDRFEQLKKENSTTE